jgi:hypothetical protein
MYLGHGPIDTPLASQHSPAINELLFCLNNFHDVKLQTFIYVSKLFESY